MAFTLFIAGIILLRIGELMLAKSNEKWMLERDAVEYGSGHYPVMVLMHTFFFVSLIAEYKLRGPLDYTAGLIMIYAGLILLKVWVITSLGRFWNTRILRIPNIELVKKGPYRFVKHPNYIIVVAEIIVIPLSFHLYYTAVLFSLLNAAMLYVRIREENKALNG